MVHFHACTATHLVREATQLLLAVAGGAAEVRTARSAVLAVRLQTNATSCVVCLMFVVFLDGGLRTWVLRHRPPREVLLRRGVRRGLGHVPAWTHCSRSRNLILEALSTASVAECVLGRIHELWLLSDHVLWAWIRVVVSASHARLRANLGCANTGSAVVVRLNGVIQKESVLVEVVLWFLSIHAVRIGERVFLRL